MNSHGIHTVCYMLNTYISFFFRNLLKCWYPKISPGSTTTTTTIFVDLGINYAEENGESNSHQSWKKFSSRWIRWYVSRYCWTSFRHNKSKLLAICDWHFWISCQIVIKNFPWGSFTNNVRTEKWIGSDVH